MSGTHSRGLEPATLGFEENNSYCSIFHLTHIVKIHPKYIMAFFQLKSQPGIAVFTDATIAHVQLWRGSI